MNPTGRSYFAWLCVGVILALSEFLVYSLSTELFKLVTDNQALQYAFKRSDVHGRLAIWPDLLVGYKFEVEYRPGTRNESAK